MRMTGKQFERFAPRARGWIKAGMMDQAPALLAQYGIDTPLRIAHFMAQIAHESGGFIWFKEIWGPTKAQRGYEGRRDLGNVRRGDGKRFGGKGPMMLTGRANYRAFTKWLRQIDPDCPDFEEKPELVAKFPYALIAAFFFWDTRNLNRYADKNDLKKITRIINGGYNGLTDRKAWFQKAWKVWGQEEEIEHVAHGKPMAKSVTVWATTAKAGAALTSLGVATDQIQDVKGKVEGVLGEGWYLDKGMVMLIMGLAIIGLAGWVIYERWRKSVEYSI